MSSNPNPSNPSLEKFEEVVQAQIDAAYGIGGDHYVAAIRSAAEVLVAEAVREQWKAFKELAKAVGVQEAITAFNTSFGKPTPAPERSK